MDYVFLDTCSWIHFACGKKNNSYDYTGNNLNLLKALTELEMRNNFKFVKNEIIDVEFKDSSVNNLIDSYSNNIVKPLKAKLKDKIIPHCDNKRIRKVFYETLNLLDEVIEPFEKKSNDFNLKVIDLYKRAIHINVSESLKQKALTHSIYKDHFLFENRNNNVNDFLILYSLQEWIENNRKINRLDETSDKNLIFLLTDNKKDFGIEKGKFNKVLGISQLIKPVNNIEELVSNLKKRKVSNEIFHLYMQFEEKDYSAHKSPEENLMNKTNDLIVLKRELLISFIHQQLKDVKESTYLKYIVDVLSAKLVATQTTTGNLPVIRSQDIVEGKLNKTPSSLLMIKKREGYLISKKEDIFLPIIGDKIGEHVINNLDYDVTIHNSLVILRSDKNKVLPKFLFFFLKVYDLKKHVDFNHYRLQLKISEIKNIKIPFPTYEEQMKFVKLLSLIHI